MLLPVIELIMVSFQITIRATNTSSKVNVTVPGNLGATFLHVTGMAPGKIYPIEISAVNSQGSGPAGSAPLSLDPSVLKQGDWQT